MFFFFFQNLEHNWGDLLNMYLGEGKKKKTFYDELDEVPSRKKHR